MAKAEIFVKVMYDVGSIEVKLESWKDYIGLINGFFNSNNYFLFETEGERNFVSLKGVKAIFVTSTSSVEFKENLTVVFETGEIEQIPIQGRQYMNKFWERFNKLQSSILDFDQAHSVPAIIDLNSVFHIVEGELENEFDFEEINL